MNLSFKFLASATPNEVDRVMEEVTNDVTSGQSLMFLFCLFVDCIVFTNFSLFVFRRRKLLITTETTVSLTSKIWQFLT